MTHEIMNLFAVPLYVSNLGRKFTDAEVQFFQEQLQEKHGTVSNFASKNKRVLDADVMKDIHRAIQGNIDNYFKLIFNTINNVELKITQSWITLTRQGESHHQHIHPNSIASGVLYINLDEDDGTHFFRNQDHLWYELVRKQDTYYNVNQYFIRTKVGDIIIFPSNVRHGVKQVTMKADRISLSFNTFFSGEMGDDEFSNALSITMNSRDD